MAATLAFAQPPERRRGRRHRPHPGDHKPWMGPESTHYELSKDEQDSARSFLQRMAPKRFEALERAKQNYPISYRAKLRWALHQKRFMDELARRAPERYTRRTRILELELRVEEMVRQWREADDSSEKREIRAGLSSALSDLFDTREADRTDELVRMESEVSRLKEQINRRAESKEAIVERRAQRLLKEPDDLEW
ncbi:MAG: hypothetical protein QGH20_06715 [Candidatus Latescibacteria bacterium]|nr:hypothetical protein [Candidatus Latescibacterota bacterium]